MVTIVMILEAERYHKMEVPVFAGSGSVSKRNCSCFKQYFSLETRVLPFQTVLSLETGVLPFQTGNTPV